MTPDPSVVLGFCAEQMGAGVPVCLAVLTHTQGGGVRAKGALMAVTAGQVAGYLSNGCVDADIITQARQALQDGASRTVHYGPESRYKDLQLPCGGAMDVLLLPDLPQAQIESGARTLIHDRQVWAFDIPNAGVTLHYRPATRLRICGGGQDARALARLADVSGFEVIVWNANLDGFPEATQRVKLTHPAHLPPADDDQWTAVVCLYHDIDWEVATLIQALKGRAVYLGAVGSRATHAQRVVGLGAAGASAADIARVRGPIGLVPSTRDASRLALSVLAEIIDAERHLPPPELLGLGMVLLAAGASQRFGADDKLLAHLNGRPLLDYAGALSADLTLETKLGIVAANTPKREAVLRAHGWQIAVNVDASRGKSTSVACGIKGALENPRVSHILLVLGDMPHVDYTHIQRLISYRDRADVVCSQGDGVPMPPLVITRAAAVEALPKLEAGEGGLLRLIPKTATIMTVDLPSDQAVDIDTITDLETLNNG